MAGLCLVMIASRKRVLVVVLGALGVALAVYLQLHTHTEWDVQAIRRRVGEYDAWAPLALVVLIAFRWVFLVPSQVALLAAGALFGFTQGTFYGMLGVTLSGVLAFAGARMVGAEVLDGRVPKGLQRAMTTARPAAVGGLVFAGTVYPVGPMSAFHFGAGLTRVGVGVFLLWVATGALLRAALFTYLGDSLVEHGVLGSWPAFLGLGLMLAPLLHPGLRMRVARWLFIPEPDAPRR